MHVDRAWLTAAAVATARAAATFFVETMHGGGAAAAALIFDNCNDEDFEGKRCAAYVRLLLYEEVR